jgi:hypothetical protein
LITKNYKMIQRIQSLYLLLTAILSFLFLKGSIIIFIDRSGYLIKMTFNQIIRESAMASVELLEKTFAVTLFIILIPVLSAIIIFIFKNRKLQKRLVRFLIIVVIAFIFTICLYAYIIITKYNSEIVPEFKMIIPLLQLIFSVLAYRGIIKDDNLVKSYDRLR